ncbi:Zona pellucida binding protein [Apodemus speciosus]|uniref:Zona pellucida binding protein n=1 Tax=Apodemus speciosus TaxID=105296 RepID=A0ABQ0F9N3_APOSI
MEALAPGRAPRGRRRAGASGSVLSALSLAAVLLSALLRAPPAVWTFGSIAKKCSLDSRFTENSGINTFSCSGCPGTHSVDQAVSVYVMLHQKSPHVLCVTQRLRDAELVDPSFQWHGPKGKLVSENTTAQVTSTGSLIFQSFEETMSGVYTCFLEYKPTVEEPIKNLQLKYIVYECWDYMCATMPDYKGCYKKEGRKGREGRCAYREPRFYYQFTARYHAAPCNSIYNISFEKKLLQILSKLVLDLSCEISLIKSECHRVKMQRAGLQNELFFTFSVASIDTEKGSKPCTDHSCEASKRLSKAKNLIERFFIQQVEVLGKRAEPLPEIYYIEGTLQMVWVNRCFPGYGINLLKHPKCPECCVVCSPGSFNPRDGTHCLQCNNSLVYGAKTCM